MKLKIDNKEFELNTERAVALGVLKEINPPVFYKVGQRFSQVFGNTTYLLCSIGSGLNSEVILIDIVRGTRWCESYKVKNVNVITEEEFGEICQHDDDFKLSE